MSSATNHPVVIRGGDVMGVEGVVQSDVLIDEAGLIAEIAPSIATPAGATELNAAGAIVGPGLVDLKANFCQPGFEEGETIESGSRAAVLGGYTAVVVMPNTDPAIDSAGVVREVRAYAETALCDIEVAGAITVGRKGEQLATMGEMAELGVKLFTEADRGVADDRLMRRAMEYAAGLGVTLALHCDVPSLSDGGHMNEGEWSSRLGIPGVPAEAEELMVMRDIALARLTGARIHFLNLSTVGALGMVDAVRRQGLRLTADVCPANFVLTDASVASFDAHFKSNPPLRSEADRQAVANAIANGSVDAIATNHHPVPAHLKDRPFDQSPAGMLGLETALSLAVDHLEVDVPALMEYMSTGPAQIAGIADRHGGPVAVGRPANLMVFDPNASWTVERSACSSLSRNTPYEGMQMSGRVRHTIVHGRPVVIDGALAGQPDRTLTSQGVK